METSLEISFEQAITVLFTRYYYLTLPLLMLMVMTFESFTPTIKKLSHYILAHNNRIAIASILCLILFGASLIGFYHGEIRGMIHAIGICSIIIGVISAMVWTIRFGSNH